MPSRFSAARSIPACAGEPSSSRSFLGTEKVYPRMCGGTGDLVVGRLGEEGLSPHVRGNPTSDGRKTGGTRSIPACAGEPSTGSVQPPRNAVYPRMCGGTEIRAVHRPTCMGLSPHVRGNQSGRSHPLLRTGSIPACAGEPRAMAPDGSPSWVYPRMCGGTFCRWSFIRLTSGLSPHVRGNLLSMVVHPANIGSIPACAGEPSSTRPRRGCARVYPRMCGGTKANEAAADPVVGLSPHVRGNLFHQRVNATHFRSIPACAGEPPLEPAQYNVIEVYPRMCGGTRRDVAGAWWDGGLSPHVRGNRRRCAVLLSREGSIPACAGEPIRASPDPSLPKVYPRMCGGTAYATLPRLPPTGLSPHVRGNRLRHAAAAAAHGSIPACAGEPPTPRCRGCRPRVYPRMCGGTAYATLPRLPPTGLSPHVRGNRSRRAGRAHRARSIPACAGEPRRSRSSPQCHRVYPRMCGGTLPRIISDLCTLGLSPHVRGNREDFS